MKLEATFTLERETKNTYRYQEEFSGSGKPPVILKCGRAARSGQSGPSSQEDP